MEASKVFENVYSGKNIKNCTKDNEHQEYIFNVYVLFGFLKLFLKYYNDCFNCITGWKKLIVSNLYSQTGHMFGRENRAWGSFPTAWWVF